jgi:hypothetical protein
MVKVVTNPKTLVVVQPKPVKLKTQKISLTVRGTQYKNSESK